MTTITQFGGLRSLARRVRNRWRRAAVVLLYHRVTTPDSDPQLLAVSPAHFDEQMAALRRVAQPLSLAELVDAMEHDCVPRRAVAVTFDDGYADNLTQAAPILRRHGVPATCFVAGSAIDGTNEFYWDELEAIFLQPGTLPDQLKLSIGSARFEQSLGEFSVYTPADSARHHGWSLEQADATPRHQAYRLLCGLLRSVSLERRDTIIDDIRRWSGRSSTVRPTHRTLTASELRTLAHDKLIEIGAHTANHAMLSSLDPAAQAEEIRSGSRRVADVLGRGVNTFSYPYGSRHSYDTGTSAIVRDAGFRCACSNFPGRTDARTDRYQVPRLLVRDWNGDHFERQLREWFDE
ncbi:MAG: polysaccharide deacetylase family protein [Planctomycetes bacterium]|nr:polysaccharide deacetylase family protein [Planctomycetota bacterium]